MNDFLQRLKQRKIVQWSLAYMAAAFALLQGIDIVAQRFGWPEQTMRLLIIALGVGFFATIVLAWYHGDRGAQRVGGTELLILALLLGLGGGVLWHFAGSLPERAVRSATAPFAALAEKSIAVLPLVNTGSDPNNEYFSDGLSEELIAVLAKVPALKIIGRSSSFLFKGTSDNSRTIGEKLGVVNLLEGSVRKQGERVRIVAALINAVDGRELWTETYDRELKDVFAVQSEIAKAVTSQLKIKLLGLPPQSDAAPLNENLAAYTAFQQGEFYISRSNEENTRKAIEFYNEAIRLDPYYALAYASLSGAWQAVAQEFALQSDEIAAAYGTARSAAQTALSLQPNIPEAHVAMGMTLLFADHNFDEAAAHFGQAEQLAPGDVGPKAALSYLLFTQGRLPEAEEITRKYLALEPLVTGASLTLGRILIARERYDEAERVLRKGAELFAKRIRWHMQITNIYLLRGKPAAALKEARLEPAGFWQDYAIALAQQAQGDRAAADGALQKFIEKHGVQGPFQVATIYALRKEPDQMFTWLERAYAGNDAGITQLLVAPFIHDYRGDPRFAALCEKLKLPASQGATGK